jgi:hypothetical protein
MERVPPAERSFPSNPDDLTIVHMTLLPVREDAEGRRAVRSFTDGMGTAWEVFGDDGGGWFRVRAPMRVKEGASPYPRVPIKRSPR